MRASITKRTAIFGVYIAAFAGSYGVAHAALPVPNLPNQKAVERAYNTLHAKAVKSDKVHAGRNLLRDGKANGRPVSNVELRKVTIKLWRQFNPQIIKKYYASNKYLYDVLNSRGVRPMVEAAFVQNHISTSNASVWRCIIRNESGYDPIVWYTSQAERNANGGNWRGWQPRFIGTDRVVGIMQMRPYHADGVPNNSRVSYATYVKLSDPVFSIEKAFRLGFGPFFAQAGRCF